MPNQEHDEFMTPYIAAMETEAREQLTAAADLITQFTMLAASKGVNLGPQSFEYIQKVGIVAKAPGIVQALLGPIEVQNDGLLPFKEVASRFPPSIQFEGCFAGPAFVLMADPYFRRGMHPNNNWAPDFIGLFWWFDGPGIEKYIALDEDRVRIDVDGRSCLEADTWFGAPFDADIRNIKPGICKLRPPSDLEPAHVGFFFADAHCLDIAWAEKNGIKSFQALEMKSEGVQIEVGGERFFPARYLHAEFDLEANSFRHFDGAIQLFTAEEYFARRDSDFNMTMKNSSHIKPTSRKLFKLNGPLSVEHWVEFCCQFCSQNPLLFEYFSGGYPKEIKQALERIRANAFPIADES